MLFPHHSVLLVFGGLRVQQVAVKVFVVALLLIFDRLGIQDIPIKVFVVALLLIFDRLRIQDVAVEIVVLSLGVGKSGIKSISYRVLAPGSLHESRSKGLPCTRTVSTLIAREAVIARADITTFISADG